MVIPRIFPIFVCCLAACATEKEAPTVQADDSGASGEDGTLEEDSGGEAGAPVHLTGQIGWRVVYDGRLECEVSWAVSGTPRELPCPDCAYTIEAAWEIQLGAVTLEDDPRCMETAFVVIGGDPAYLEGAMNTYGNTWAFVDMGGDRRALIGYVYQGIDYQVLDYSFSAALDWNGAGEFQWATDLGEIYYAYPYEPGSEDTGEESPPWGMVSVAAAGATP
jgi:hypothetical protein